MGVLSMFALGVCYIIALIVAFGHYNTPTFVWWWYLVGVTSICLARALRAGGTACTIVCFAYFHRSAFMHCTVERDCLFDVALCSPLWGRTVACIGELAMVHLIFSRVVPRRAPLYVTAIAIAECISFLGVIKRQYWFFMFENGTWMVVAAIVAATIAKNWARGQLGDDARELKLLAMFALGFLAVYNAVEDLPMYYRRSQELDYRRGLSFLEGLGHSAVCQQVTSSEAVWRPQMIWMGLNYTLAPFACLYIQATTTIAAKRA